MLPRDFKPLRDDLSAATARPQTARRLVFFFAAAVLVIGDRTVSAVLRLLSLMEPVDPSTCHRLFSHRRRSARQLARVIACFVIDRFVASSLLKNAVVAFFNLARLRAKLLAARKISTYVAILTSHPCDAATVEKINRLPEERSRSSAMRRSTGIAARRFMARPGGAMRFAVRTRTPSIAMVANGLFWRF